MRKRGDSFVAFKALFNSKNYSVVADKSEPELKSEYVVVGSSTKRTLTLEINYGDIKVYLHDEDGISLLETVPFKNIKSVTVPTKNVVAMDWTHGPYQTHDVSKFHTSEGEAKQIRDRFYQVCTTPR